LEASIRQLVQNARDGDAEAFCMLIRWFERAAISTAYGVLGDFSAAGDVTQDVFLDAWQRLPELRDADRFAAWLMQMVRNRSIDAKRRRPPASVEPEIAPASLDVVPSGAMETAETRRRIDTALAVLDELSRQAVAMRYFEKLSSKEIAERLGLSVSAVDMRLSRARHQLRELLADLAVS
jgi:RNA polymerase sigma-70 factor (ECF subfamily)